MTSKKFILLALFITCTPKVAPFYNHANPGEQSSEQVLGQTDINIPSWEDLGMEDLLANTSESSAETESPVSFNHSPHSWGTTPTKGPAHSAPAQRGNPLPHRASDYYVYYLYRLRL